MTDTLPARCLTPGLAREAAAASARWDDRRRCGVEPVREPVRDRPQHSLVRGARLPRQARRRRLRPRRLRRGRCAGAGARRHPVVRGPRGRRRPDAARRLRRVAGRSPPRLRHDRREPQAARRLLGRHGAPCRNPPAHRARHVLRARLHGHGQPEAGRLVEGALPARDDRTGAARRGPGAPGRPVHRRDRHGQGDGAARRRLPLAAARDARHAVGDRPRRVRSSSSRTSTARRGTSTGS